MKDSFVIYTKYEEQINMLSDEQAGVLFRALMRYQNGAELPAMDDVTAMAFAFIKQQIDLDKQKREEICQINKANGQLGGRPSKSLTNKGNKPKKPNGFQTQEEKPNGFENNQTVSEKIERILKETTSPQKERSKEKYTPLVQENIPLFIPPKGEQKNDFADEFFELYPRYAKDRTKMRVDVDYKRLIEEFSKSKYLRSLYTVKQINEAYPLIIAGDYRDKEKENPFAGIDAKAARERWYAERKAKAENKANKVLDRFLQDEEFKRIHKRLNAIPCEIGKAEYQAENGDAKAQEQLVELTQEKARLTLQYRGIIERNGMTEEDLLPKWHCRKCQDTGYLPDDRMCDCYLQEVAL